jgi:hypothetical protein
MLTAVTLNIATEFSITVTQLHVVDWCKVCGPQLEQSTGQERVRGEIR